MAHPATVINLTRDNISVYLSIFGDVPGGDGDRRRRRSVRRPSQYPMEFLRGQTVPAAEMCRGQCIDVSEDGVGFRCREALAIGEKLQLYLPGEDQEYTVAAEVVHVAEQRGHYRIGAKFVWK